MNIVTAGLFLILGVLLVVIGLAVFGSQEADMHQQTVPDAAYLKALESSDPSKYTLPEPGSAEEQAMVQGVIDLFGDYSAANIQENLGRVYAEDFYFRDAFRAFDDRDTLLAYMLHGLKPLRKCEFVFADYSQTGGDFYLRWTMRLNFASQPEDVWDESMGMTHIRFNSEGKVIFHQDFWDPTDVLYKRIPVVAQVIAAIKKRM